MANYLVMNPTFSAFRTGEPTAFLFAQLGVNKAHSLDFELTFIDKGEKSKKVRVVGHDGFISVYIGDDTTPFDFNVVEL
jgi:hypothetical protein